MAQSGRPRQPIDLIVAKGKKHLTKKEIEERKKQEVKAPADNIHAPDYLTEKQKAKFEEIAKTLDDMNIMSNLDCHALARYISAVDIYEELTKKMRSPKTLSDIETLEKYAKLQDRYFKQCHTAANALGLSISSRCKLVLPPSAIQEAPKENKFARFTS
jgi:P27 family predicted phage terminase small subunit